MVDCSENEGELRATLQAGALTILGADGVDGLNARRLATLCGTTPSVVERCYPSAVDCVAATYDAVAAGVLADLAGAADGERSCSAALSQMLEALLRRMDARPNEARLCFVEILRSGREGARHHVAARHRIVALVTEAIRERRLDALVDSVQVELLVGAVFQALAGLVATPEHEQLLGARGELVAHAHALNPLIA